MYPSGRAVITFLAVVALLFVGFNGVKGMLADRDANSIVVDVVHPTTCRTLTVRVPVSQQEQLSNPDVLADWVLAHPDALVGERTSIYC